MENAFSLGKYLRCPIIDEKVTKATFGDVVDKSQKQLAKWKANSLSQASRTVLINSNLSARASFQMQSFSLPVAILDDIYKVNTIFFWNKNPNSESANLIGWYKICKPKCFGGLGIRKACL